ncbi:uncharacterized protein DUF3631 [Kribbella sp. VKM Ac-2527]|uniref:Uncharacterized protein DUF3631 n=1 Tax=Kribbella caucasensis TaxID=2512215 RepID=A0A4R6KRR7_9ACTN|nr:DUF3631 domain-containing protein [Kribbella sp. VKM Ac-2527]TDO52619.1 uncharacterized protein DUF3631 [Kribbella sp. VKM Ac-2527]
MDPQNQEEFDAYVAELLATEATGAQLLDELHATLTRYVVFPSAEAADAVTLYVAATHAQPAWEHATRLVIKSPIKRCGKSRLQEIIAETCHRPLRTANCSTAALVRSIGGDDPPTILLDEADTIFGGKKSSKDGVAEDLRGFINAGHSRGVPYLRWDMTARQLEECPTFGMAVLGGIGDMPDTIEDRAVIVSMRRRGPTETVAQFRRRNVPALHDLQKRLHEWIRPCVEKLAATEPTMPVQDRAADTWEPLVIVAEHARGDWPDRARRACLTMTGERNAEDDTAGERLLADLYDVWGDEEYLFTTTVLDRLQNIDEAPWADWYGKPLTNRGLAHLLKPYGIRSRTVREPAAVSTAKGYARADLTDPWGRYVTSVTASQTDESAGQPCDGRVTDDESASVTSPDLRKHPDRDAVTDVTDEQVEPAIDCPACARWGIACYEHAGAAS